MFNYFKVRNYRIQFEELKSLMEEYWSKLPQQEFEFSQISYSDSKESKIIRKKIVKLLPHVIEGAEYIGIDHTFQSFPMPAVGGPVIPVSAYNSIINPNQGHKEIEPTLIEDTVEKSISMARMREKEVLIHWLCPWNWLIDLCVVILRIPFIILRRAGVPSKIEENIVAHVIKVLFVVTIVTYLTYKGLKLESLDLSNVFKF